MRCIRLKVMWVGCLWEKRAKDSRLSDGVRVGCWGKSRGEGLEVRDGIM